MADTGSKSVLVNLSCRRSPASRLFNVQWPVDGRAVKARTISAASCARRVRRATAEAE